MRGCTATDLTVRLGQASGAAGHVGVSVVFTHRGGSPCALAGYPRVSIVDAGGRQVGAGAQRQPAATTRPVTLLPGAAASATFVVANGTGYEPPTAPPCSQAPVAGLRVYPPDATTSVMLAWPVTVCTGVRPWISAVVPGTGG